MTTSIADLERIALGHWRPSTCEPLDTWVLRAHHGFTGRANSALALGIPGATPAVAAPGRVPSSSPDSALDPGLDQVREPALTRALDRVGAFYARRGLPARIAVPVPADCPAPVAGPPSTMPAEALAHLPEPEDAGEQLRLRYLLDRAGWLPTAGTSAFTMTLAPGNPGDCDLPPGYGLRGTPTPSPARVDAHRHLGAPVPPAGRALMVSAPRQHFLTVTAADGATAAVARASLSGGWVGITAVEVLPGHRRQGLARALLTAITVWALAAGAHRLFLQTTLDNTPSHRLYLSSGFRVHHRYDYLSPS